MASELEKNLDKIDWRLELADDAGGGKRIAWVEADAKGERRLMEETRVSEWRKFSVWFLGLLPIESQL
jgi:cardiolipin synthase C